MASEPESPSSASSQARALDNLIERASEELAQDSEPDGLLFLGAWHDAYPSILVHDPFLTDSAKIHLLYLMQEARRRPHGAIAMPSIDKTATALGHARGTAIRDRLLLRVTRWISLCRRVRDQRSGRFRGHVHAIHSEPCSLPDATHLDAGYMHLLDEMAAHHDPAVRRAGAAALAGLTKDIDDGNDPLSQPDPIARRMAAAEAVQTRRGAFFDMVLADEAPAPDAGQESGHSQVQNLNVAPGSNFEPGYQPIENKESSKFEPGPCSSSIKTTTTEERGTLASVEDFRWPSQFDDNVRRLIQRVLHKWLPDRSHQDAQEIIDVLAHKADDATAPLRNPVAYAVALCRRVNSGEFQALSAPGASSAPNPGAAADTARQEARQEVNSLMGEIRSVDRLLSAATGTARQSLEKQLCDLQQRLRVKRHELELGIAVGVGSS